MLFRSGPVAAALAAAAALLAAAGACLEAAGAASLATGAVAAAAPLSVAAGAGAEAGKWAGAEEEMAGAVTARGVAEEVQPWDGKKPPTNLQQYNLLNSLRTTTKPCPPYIGRAHV